MVHVPLQLCKTMNDTLSFFYAGGAKDAHKCEKSAGTWDEREIKDLISSINQEEYEDHEYAGVEFPSRSMIKHPEWRDDTNKFTYWQGFIEQLSLNTSVDVSTLRPRPVHELKRLQKDIKMATRGSRTIKAATHGAKVAAADKAADNLVIVFEKALGKSYPDGLKTPTGRELVKFFIGAGILEIHTRNPGLLPVNDGVGAACELVVDASTRNVVGPLLKKLTPALKKLAAAGKAVEEASASES